MNWLTFKERWPEPPKLDQCGAMLCAFPGRDPFIYRPFLDPDRYTERADFMWLEGHRFPPVPSVAELQQRKALSKAA